MYHEVREDPEKLGQAYKGRRAIAPRLSGVSLKDYALCSSGFTNYKLT
jgi:hypothetical protein